MCFWLIRHPLSNPFHFKFEYFSPHYIPIIFCRLLSEARAAAHQYDCKYAETSAALNHHVDELLVGILKQIRLHLENREPEEKTVKKHKERKGSFKIARGLLSKLFGKHSKKDKSCENLYEL